VIFLEFGMDKSDEIFASRSSDQVSAEIGLSDQSSSIVDLLGALKNGMDSQFAKLNGKVDLLSENVATIQSELTATRDSLNGAIKRIDCLEQENSLLQSDNFRLKSDLSKVRNRLINLEKQSRNENLIFYGISESEPENCEEKVRKVFSDIMKVDDACNLQISLCHRVGTKRTGASSRKPRPILVKFIRGLDKRKVLQKRDNLKTVAPGSNISVSHDFPEEIRQRREILKKILNKAKSLQMNAYLSADKLFIDNKPYTIDTILQLKAINPKLIATQDIGSNAIGFFSMASPLSNFHPAPFDLDGKHFESVEQYFHYCKAHFFEDFQTASKIINASTPIQCLSLGKLVKTSDSTVNARWQKEVDLVMKKGCCAKFRQNSHLATFLLGTGRKSLVEANPHDKYWSAGLNLDDSKLCDSQSWPGQNKLGLILESVRDILSR